MRGLAVLFREARRRRVFRTVGLYIIASWVLLQVLDLALESFGFPDVAMRFLWYAALAGLPLALVFGWSYDLTPEGIRKTPPADTVEDTALALQAADYALLLAMVAIGAAVAWRTASEVRDAAVPIETIVDVGISPNSLAVLPLDNLSGSDDQNYLSAGIHDALITSLSKLRSLQVTSRTSTLRVGRDLAIPAIGEQLGVARIIEGSVTREGNRVRVIVQLIDAASDTHIWADSFEREFDGLLSMQNEITRAVARAVEIQLSPAEQQALPLEVSVRPDTYETYLRARHMMHRETFRAYRRGIELMREAVDRDPDSALANAGLAYAYTKLGHSPMLPDLDAYRGARDHALRAIELDDSLAEAHLAIGMYRLYQEWNWVEAERSFLRALEINPSQADVHYHYAWLLELYGDEEKSLLHGEITTRLSPLSPFMHGWLADQYRDAGDYERALEMAETTLELSDDYPVGLLIKGWVYSETGRHEEAIEVHRQLGDDPFWAFALGTTYARAGHREEAEAILATVPKTPNYTAPLILINAALHNDDAVLHWIGIAEEIRAAWYPWFVTWFHDTRYLAGHPEMQARARKLGLPQQTLLASGNNWDTHN